MRRYVNLKIFIIFVVPQGAYPYSTRKCSETYLFHTYFKQAPCFFFYNSLLFNAQLCFFSDTILIPVTGFLLERYLEYLNAGMRSEILPEKLKGICDQEEYRKTQLYEKDNLKLSFWSSSFNLVIIIAMIAAGGFALVDDFARSLSSNNVVIALIFFGIIGFASEMINLPFGWYDTFVIEKKYGFNTMTIRTFITDHLKSWFIALARRNSCPWIDYLDLL